MSAAPPLAPAAATPWGLARLASLGDAVWRSPARVLALVFAWLGATAGLRPLMLPDEGRYVGVAWEMLRSGDWLTPTLNGLPFFHKPPLFYWLTAGALSVMGRIDWAARVAPLMGATLGVWALYLFLNRWASPRVARLALLALLAQPLFFIGGQFANLDMLVAGCIGATTLLAAHAALQHEHGLPHRGPLLGAWALAGLGLLAKGLIGLVLPGAVLLAWLLLRRRWRALAALLWWPGPLLMLAIAGPWFWAEQQRFGGFLHYFFVVQHFQRFAVGGFNNVQPFWFYPAVLALFTLPWLPGLRRWPSLGLLGPAADPQRPVRLLMLLWLVVVVGFFSLPKSKLLGYVLPAVPALAALLADAQARLQPERTGRGPWLAAGVAALLGLAAVLGLALAYPHSQRSLAATLAAQRSAGQPVYMAGEYFYDLPFYAGLQQPVHVVDQWRSPEVALRDNWRKELVDAGQFTPDTAARLLVVPEDWPAALCAQPVSWVMAPPGVAAKHPFLQAATTVVSNRDATLWRVDLASPALVSALGCGQKPSAGSTGK